MASIAAAAGVETPSHDPNGTGSTRFGVANMIGAQGATSKPFAYPSEISAAHARFLGDPGMTNKGR